MAKIDILQVAHIVSNIIALTVLTLFFNSKNKVLSDRIKELEVKMIEQQSFISRHEQLLQKLLSGNRSLTPSFTLPKKKPTKETRQEEKEDEPILPEIVHIPNPMGFVNILDMFNGGSSFHAKNDTRVEEMEEEEEEVINEEILDNELKSELKELQTLVDSNNSNINLKKDVD